MTRRRFGLSTGKKVVLCIAGLLIAWQFLKLPELLDAFLTFCLAGVVPGTDIVLSPDTVMRTAGITVGAIILLLALRPLIRALFTKNKTPSPQESEPAYQQDSLPTEPAAPIITPAEAFRQQVYVTEAVALAELDDSQQQKASPAWLQRFATAVDKKLERIMPRLFTLLVKAGVATQPKLATAKLHLIRAYYVARAYSVRSSRWTVARAKAFWRWTVPYLWQFDRWIELKVRSLEGRIKHKVNQHDTATTVVDLGRHTKKTIAELDVPTKVKKVRTKAKPYVSKAHATAKKTARKARKRVKK